MASINDIIPKKAIDGILATDKAITKLDESTLKYVATLEVLTQATKKGADEAKKAKEVQKESEKVQQAEIKIAKEQKAAIKSLEAQRKKGLAQLAKAESKEREYQAALNLTVKSEKDLATKTNALTKKRYELDKTTKKGAAEFRKLTKEINKNNLALQKSQKSTGVATRGVGKYAAGIKSAGMQLAGALGLTSLVYLFIGGIKNAINTIKEFGKQQAILAGVLNKSVIQIIALTDQAVKLGGKYPTLAKEVTALQISYARLGFTQTEILALTEATILGSIALNSELDATASLVGAVVKSFDNLKATDARQIMDELTASTQKSSLSFSKLEVALPKVAGAANALGIPLKRVLAELGASIDATQDASTAGTGLRKIYLTLAQTGLTLDQSLEKINKSTNKLKTSYDLFGVRAAIVGLALANNIEKTNEVEEAIDNAGGTVERVAKTQIDTFAGSVDGASSSWERLMLTFKSSEGTLKKAVDGWTDLVDTIQLMASLEISLKNWKQLLIANAIGFGNISKAAKEAEQKYSNFTSKIDAANKDSVLTEQKFLEGLLKDYESFTDKSQYKITEKKLEYVNKRLVLEREAEAEAEDIKAKALIVKAKEAALAEIVQAEKINNIILELGFTTQQKQFAAIDRKAEKFRESGAAEIDIANFVEAAKGKIIQAAALKAFEAESELAQTRADIEEQTTDFVQKQEDKKLAIRKKAAEDAAKAAEAVVFTDEEEEITEGEDDFGDLGARLAAAQSFADKAFEANKEAQVVELEDLQTLLDAKLISEEEFYAGKDELRKADAERDQATKDKLKELAIAATNGAFDIYKNSIDRELQVLNTSKNYELKLAKGNKSEEEKINAKFDAKEIALKEKKDRATKAQALFNIAVSTAVAIASASPLVPLMIIAGALGAIQLAVAASAPLPQYYTGVDSIPTDGPVSLAERGREIVEKNNKKFLVKEQTVASGLKGAKVYKNSDTEMILNSANRSEIQRIDMSEFRAGQDRTNMLLEGLSKRSIRNGGTHDLIKNKITFPV
jgi:TP901 family phage tail tape measure protein